MKLPIADCRLPIEPSRAPERGLSQSAAHGLQRRFGNGANFRNRNPQRVGTTRAPLPNVSRAFTLLEVMIAIAIFFVASFAILGLVSSSLDNVRRLQRPSVDATPVLARFAATNSLVENIYSGNLGDPEMLGKEYRDYNWTAEIVEVASNKLFGVTAIVRQANGRREIVSQMSTVLYRPLSPPGRLDGGPGMRGR